MQIKDAIFLPQIELRAAQSFQELKGFEWIANMVSMPIEKHRLLIQQQTSWVAYTKQNRLIGFVCAQVLAEMLHIHELSVDSIYQRHGIGRQLMQTCICKAQSQCLKGLTLTTFEHVPWNRPWYERLGFRCLRTEELTPMLQSILEQEGQGMKTGLANTKRCAMLMHLA